MGLSFSDYDNTYLKELDWMYGRLIVQINAESSEGQRK